MSFISLEEKFLLDLLSGSLCGCNDVIPIPQGVDLDSVIIIADAHRVTSLLYDLLMQYPLSDNAEKKVETAGITAASQSYRLLFLGKYITEKCKEEGIELAVLKGMATASFYPNPTLRKSGDVDLFLSDKSKLARTCELFGEMGFVKASVQNSNHHIVFEYVDGIEIELHTELAEAFDSGRMNSYMRKIESKLADHIIPLYVDGVCIPGLDNPYHAYELLLHMLQHFLRSGFGLKLLCDWVVFWNSGIDESDGKKYIKLVKECGLKAFSDQITSVCCKYLGLDWDKVSFMKPGKVSDEQFLAEIFAAEEFGKSSNDRMVALRGSGVVDYIREFHHQTRLNYPKLGRIAICWPVLWIITLIRFLNNNRKLRRTSTVAVLKNASRRGKIIKELELFKK